MRWTFLFLHWNPTNVTVSWQEQQGDDFMSYVILTEKATGTISVTETPGNVDLMHACRGLFWGVHVNIHLHTFLHSSTSPTTPLLPLFLCLTSHNPLWFPLSSSPVSTLCSLLKTWFSQPSHVSHPSSSSAYSLVFKCSFLPILFPNASVSSGSGDVALEHIMLLSYLNLNLKRDPVGILPLIVLPL